MLNAKLGVALLLLTLSVGSTAAARDPADQTFGPRPLHPDNWIDREDFPPAALIEHKGGMTRFALSIDEKGHPYRCAIEQSSGLDVLDNKACEMMLRRGRFIPARDRDGRPLPSRWSNSVNWRVFGTDQQNDPVADLDLTVKALPDGKSRALFTVVQTFRPDGAIERCAEIYPSKIAAIDAKACFFAEALKLQGPLTDEQGHPVRGIRVARVSIMPENAATK